MYIYFVITLVGVPFEVAPIACLALARFVWVAVYCDVNPPPIRQNNLIVAIRYGLSKIIVTRPRRIELSRYREMKNRFRNSLVRPTSTNLKI